MGKKPKPGPKGDNSKRASSEKVSKKSSFQIHGTIVVTCQGLPEGARGKRLNVCQKYMDKYENVGVPSIVVFEVCRKVAAKVSEDEALRVAAWLRTFGILNLTDEIASYAVDLSLSLKLGMADSLVLAHA